VSPPIRRPRRTASPRVGRSGAGRPGRPGRRQPSASGHEYRTAGRRTASGDDLGGDQVEGVQAVRELLRARRRQVFDLYLADEGRRSEPHDEIARLASSAGVLARRVGMGELRTLAGSEVPQGVVAFAEPIAPTPLSALVGAEGTRPFLVVLDGVTDPQNLGALMRTALSAGATGLVLPRHRAVRLTPSAVKAAAGAVEHLPIALVPGVPAALQNLDDAGVWRVGLDEAGTTDIDDVDLFAEPIALVLGAEGPGLAPLTRERCDVLARIDLVGPLASINVSAAGAVACFAVARRRRRPAGG
jgi:23S rRNA (guanosine2251-2'-O)-methyltransferase